MTTVSPASGLRRRPRIAIGGILHETHTFAPGVTDLAAFGERVLLSGADMIPVAAGSDSALGGVIAPAAGRAELAPTIFASAMPGPPVSDDVFEQLASELLHRLRQASLAWPGVAGVVLLLHGAMVTTSDHDPEGTLLERVRAMVGPDRPVVAVLDSHATVTARMVAAADLLIAYQTYPHLDSRARGREAMEACLAQVGGRPAPVVAHRKLPLLMPLLAQSTDAGSPLAELIERAGHWRDHAGISAVSLVPGFPWADVPEAGASVLVYAGSDPALAAHAADDLAARWWDARASFQVTGAQPGHILDLPPVDLTVVADVADNPGAGAPSDATHLLRFFLDHALDRAAFACIVDPAAVAACHEAGTGATIPLAIGGRSGPLSGGPVDAEWRVMHLGDGVFTNRGPMARGGVNRIGRTATICTQGISVILSERRAQVLDPAVFDAGGIDPDGYRWLVVKSSVHYRAAFRALATHMIEIETQGLAASTLGALPYNRVRRPIWPLDSPELCAVSAVDEDAARV